MVNILLNEPGINVNAVMETDVNGKGRNKGKGKGSTALSVAASMGQRGIVAFLLNKNRANMHVRDQCYGMTVLHHAIASGEKHTALYIMDCYQRESEATTTTTTSTTHTTATTTTTTTATTTIIDTDNQGRNILHIACIECDDELVGEIIHRLDYVTKKHLIRCQKDEQLQQQQQQPHNLSPLEYAVERGLSKTVQAMVPFSTTLQILHAQEQLTKTAFFGEYNTTRHRSKIHHVLFTELVKRCHGGRFRSEPRQDPIHE